MKPTDVVDTQNTARQVGADALRQSPRLVRQGLSEFQKMWAAVYQETEQVTRHSGVGEPPGGESPEGRINADAPGRNVPASSSGAAKEMGGGRFASSVASARGAASSAEGGSAPHLSTISPGLRPSISMETLDLDAGIPMSTQVARLGVGSGLSSMLSPVLPGTKGVIPPELLASPLFTDEVGASIPMDAADVTAFRAVLDHLRALDPKNGQTVVLRLAPGIFGDLSVAVSVTGREVRTDWMTSNTEVKTLLDGNQVWLRDALAQQGLNVEHFSVNVGDPNGYFEEADRRMRQEGHASGEQAVLRRSFIHMKSVG